MKAVIPESIKNGNNINEHIIEILNNEYSGSERKMTVIMDDYNKYMLKLPDMTREIALRAKMSYINNTISEHLGSSIMRICGIPSQQTYIGEYSYVNSKNEEKKVVACLCKDLRDSGEKLISFDNIELSLFSEEDTNFDITFCKAKKIINSISGIDDIEKENIWKKYNDLFIVDALIGNTDRHFGNIGIVVDETTGAYVRFAEIYDCGSSLFPLIDDELIKSEKLPLSHVFIDVSSVFKDEDGMKIKYSDFLLDEDCSQDIKFALKRVIPNIDFEKIFNLIDSTPLISKERKQFLKAGLEERYNKIIVPSLVLACNKDIKPDLDANNEELGKFYYDNLKQFKDIPVNDFARIKIQGNEINVKKLNNRYVAILNEQNVCEKVLPIRSNNKEIRSAISIINDLFEKGEKSHDRETDQIS